MITWPGAYHSGINTGYNLNEAINFARENCLEFGAVIPACTCGGPSTGLQLALQKVRDEVYAKKVEVSSS